MSQTSMDRPRPSARMMDKWAIISLAACVFALIVFPLFTFIDPPSGEEVLSGSVSRPENRIFWPAMAAISVILAVQNRSRFTRLSWPPHIACLLVYLVFAGASVLWAFRPEIAFIRFVQQVMIVTSIVLPTMLAARTTDMMRGLFLCFAFASILNVFFVLDGTQTIVVIGAADAHHMIRKYLGSPGYFRQKNQLGEFATTALLLSLHEILYPGRRRVLGIIGVGLAISLIFSSDSKTALGLALISPILAGLTLITRKITRISPAIILLSIPLCYVVSSSISHYNMNLLSYKLYGDPTFTGRTVIWDFAQQEIERSPLLGWGYQSFWLVPGSPAAEAPGYWIKMMPEAHNGYYDTMLEMGYVGLAFLVIFIITTLHAIGRLADRDPPRAWLVLSLALFIILYNFLESLWMRGFEFLWVVFLILAAEIGRYWQPLPLRERRTDRGGPRPRRFLPSPSAKTFRPGIRLS
jgi:exopolysaccharide production protein ExoQ